MTIKSWEARKRAEKLTYVQALIAEAGSVRAAAKVAGMRRPNFIRLRKTLSQQRDNLTPSAPAATT